MPSYDVRARTQAGQEQVFALLADATTWPKWAGWFVLRGWFDPTGETAPGGVGAVRRLGTRWLATREPIVEYDAPHYLAYTLLGPGPIRDYRAIVSVDREGDGSRITWAAAFETRIPGTGRLITWVLKRIIGGMALGLARYAERNDER